MPIPEIITADSGEEPVKQVIVIRRDLGMRRGKEIAQGAHAAMAWLTRRMDVGVSTEFDDFVTVLTLSQAEHAWVTGSFTKVTLQVQSLDELMAVFDEAEATGLTVSLITDAGKTEFAGEPTVTCLAIGPDYAGLIDPITKDLRLY